MPEPDVLTGLGALRARLLIESLLLANDEFEQNALRRIVARFDQISSQIRGASLTEKSRRYPEIARMVEEIDPSVIPPEIGGRLIEIEEFYRSY